MTDTQATPPSPPLVPPSVFGAGVALYLTAIGLSGCISLEQTSWGLSEQEATSAWQVADLEPTSAPVEVLCGGAAGSTEIGDSMLAGLQGLGFPESTSTPHITGLVLDCVEYLEFGSRYLQGTRVVSTLTSEETAGRESFSDDLSTSIRVSPDQYPIGLLIVHDAAESYVENLQLISATMDGSGVLADSTDWWEPEQRQLTRPTISNGFDLSQIEIEDARTANDGPRNRALLCAPQQVLTGVRFHQDAAPESKIRSMTIFCSNVERA